MPTKIGGGNKQQEYDEKNGRYGTGNLLEFKTAQDGIQYQLITGKEPPMPVFSPKNDNEEYARWWVDNVFVKWLEYKHYLDPRKVNGYLLVPKKVDDKSHLLNHLGYFRDKNNDELYDLIEKQAEFHKAKYSRMSPYGVKIELIIDIPSKETGRIYKFKAIWMVDDSKEIKFLTLIPYDERKNKNGKEN